MSTTDTPSNITTTLEPILSERFALKWHDFAICSWFACFFMYMSYLPLFHSDIWGHVMYGKWILEHGVLPQQDPFMSLAAGMRLVDNAWASQVFLAWIHDIGGAQAISTCFAVVVLLVYVIQFRVFYLMSGSKWIALAGTMTSFGLVITRHAVIRPEIFGALLFSLLLWILVHFEPWRRRSVVLREQPSWRRPPLWVWIAIPIMFAVWANVHGSFAVGLVVLGCHGLGRACDVLYRSRSIRVLLRDVRFRQWILLTELALLATLVNPYGIDLLIQTATFGKNPNLREILEWYPLTLVDLEGIQFSIAALAVLFLWRHSRQRVRPVDIAMLGLFAFTVATTVRMLSWFAPIFAFTMIPHLTAICSRWKRSRQPAAAEDPSSVTANKFAFTMLTLLVIWCAFAFSPASQPLLSDKPVRDEQLYSQYTPLKISQYLRENPPKGLVYAPQWWGDWMIWDGPEHPQVMVTTNIHLVPRQVWRNYMQVQIAAEGWERILDHYGIRTLIVHKEMQRKLARVVRKSGKWNIAFETDLGIVLKRNKSL